MNTCSIKTNKNAFLMILINSKYLLYFIFLSLYILNVHYVLSKTHFPVINYIYYFSIINNRIR